jgi:hypothetical protein
MACRKELKRHITKGIEKAHWKRLETVYRKGAPAATSTQAPAATNKTANQQPSRPSSPPTARIPHPPQLQRPPHPPLNRNENLKPAVAKKSPTPSNHEMLQTSTRHDNSNHQAATTTPTPPPRKQQVYNRHENYRPPGWAWLYICLQLYNGPFTTYRRPIPPTSHASNAAAFRWMCTHTAQAHSGSPHVGQHLWFIPSVRLSAMNRLYLQQLAGGTGTDSDTDADERRQT